VRVAVTLTDQVGSGSSRLYQRTTRHALHPLGCQRLRPHISVNWIFPAFAAAQQPKRRSGLLNGPLQANTQNGSRPPLSNWPGCGAVHSPIRGVSNCRPQCLQIRSSPTKNLEAALSGGLGDGHSLDPCPCDPHRQDEARRRSKQSGLPSVACIGLRLATRPRPGIRFVVT